MRLICSPVDSNYAGIMRIPAHTRVVLPDHAAIDLLRRVPATRISGLGNYTRHYCGQDLAGRHLLAWRGVGIGDQIVFAGILKILKTRWPTCQIDYYMHPYVWDTLWRGVPDLPFTPWPAPIHWDDWRANHYHYIGEALNEDDQEPDQPCVWDGHLAAAGIDPASIDPAHKRPVVPITDADRAAAAEWLQTHCIPPADRLPDRPLILWQWASSTPVRTVHPTVQRVMLETLAREFPGAAIVVLGTRRQADGILAPPAPQITVETDLALRTAFALVARADCLVCPDSSLGHVAGGLAIPCVSLWSSFHPDDRVRYYPTHRPLYQGIPCSPCRVHETSPTEKGCPLVTAAAPWGPYCAGLAQIQPDQVVRQVKECLENG